MWSSEWSDLYPKDSEAYNIIEEIANTFYLVRKFIAELFTHSKQVNIVDNDFIRGDIWAIFQEIIEAEAMILAEIEETKKEKVKALEAKLQELELQKKKLEDERKAFEIEKTTFLASKSSA